MKSAKPTVILANCSSCEAARCTFDERVRIDERLCLGNANAFARATIAARRLARRNRRMFLNLNATRRRYSTKQQFSDRGSSLFTNLLTYFYTSYIYFFGHVSVFLRFCAITSTAAAWSLAALQPAALCDTCHLASHYLPHLLDNQFNVSVLRQC